MELVKDPVDNVCDLCKNCRLNGTTATTIGNDDSDTHINDNTTYEKCSKWLRTISYSDAESVCSSEVSDRSEVTKSSEESEGYGEEFTSGNKEIMLCGDIDHDQHELIFRNTVNTYKNVTITKSKNVHLGNITYINGPVYVNQTANIVNRQTIINQYINNNNNDLDVKPPRIVDRRGWVAQPPLAELEEMKKPAKYVIIIHSATEEASTQPDNVLIVRLIQQFHIESRKWDDIAYNFLIGGDSNVYEGRGWNTVGAHTYLYNKFSIGIAFVGCYINTMPPKVSLDTAKRLIKYGVKIGAIDPDYRLVGHSQCISTESPGRMLFKEIKTWDHWDGTLDVKNPAPETLTDICSS